jgi:hypothetical protein
MDPELYKLTLDVISDAIKILGPAAITGLVAYKAGRAQHELHLKELDKSNEYKARERLFDFHKGKLDENKAAMSSLANELGQFAGMTAADLKDDSKLNQFVRGHLSTYIDNLPFEVSHIKKEMQLYPGKFDQEDERMKDIETSIQQIKKPTDPTEVLETIHELFKIYGFFGHCIRMLIEFEAGNIFEPYLKNA